jgi:hypothetical protein
MLPAEHLPVQHQALHWVLNPHERLSMSLSGRLLAAAGGAVPRRALLRAPHAMVLAAGPKCFGGERRLLSYC